MSYTLLQTSRPTEMLDLLNGVVIAPKPLQARMIPKGAPTNDVVQAFDGLNGKTLEFTTPAVTVTFTDADPITVEQMLAAIDTQVRVADANFEGAIVNAGVAPGGVNPPEKRLKMLTGTAAGLVIDLASSTAAALLGFPTSGTLSGVPVTASKIVAGGDNISGGLYVILAP